MNGQKIYIATVYKDAENANWKTKPTAYKVDSEIVTSKSIFNLKLAPGGGCAISIKEIQ